MQMPLVYEGKDIPSIIPNERKNVIFNYRKKKQNSISTSITNTIRK